MTSTALSTVARLRRTTRRSAAAVAALTAMTSLAAAACAQAAGPAPNFQMPLQCGQMWEATTYEDHGPDPDSIDLGMWDADDNNISSGEPVLASADGVVTSVKLNGKNENQVYLDHGNGWTTQHKHLESLPPLTVGQHVAQGEQIGRVGNTGIQPIAFHLHYTQLADGVAVRVRFNGSLIDTHEGDTSSWNKWSTRTGEQLTSNNCPGRAFLPFDQGGRHHLYAYEAARGAAGIASIANDGSGVTNPWGVTSGNRRLTHFMPFKSGNVAHYISYASSTGAVEFGKIGTAGPAKLASGTWGKGWTHFMPLTLGGQPYYVAYNSLTGAKNIDRINAAGTGASTVQGGTWTTGWTQLVPFTLGGVQHFLTYRGGTGEVKINKITGAGDSVTVANVWQGTWATGLTHIVPMTHDGSVRLLRYSQATGAVTFDRVNASGAGIVNVGAASWTANWSTLSPYSVNGAGHVLAYKTTGLAKILKLDAAGGAMSVLSAQGWTLGLA
jgi:hypothetical protein